MGRPSKLTEDLEKLILEEIRAGSFHKIACQRAGISDTTFRNWMNRGKKELERVAQSPRRRIRRKERIYTDFFQNVLKAEAFSESELVKLWRRAAPEDWRAAAEFLARRYPERWSPTRKVQLTVDWREKVKDLGFDPDDVLRAATEFLRIGAECSESIRV